VGAARLESMVLLRYATWLAVIGDKDTIVALAGLVAAIGNAVAIVMHALASMQRPRKSSSSVNGSSAAP
jgi:hypothetical protein